MQETSLSSHTYVSQNLREATDVKHNPNKTAPNNNHNWNVPEYWTKSSTKSTSEAMKMGTDVSEKSISSLRSTLSDSDLKLRTVLARTVNAGSSVREGAPEDLTRDGLGPALPLDRE